MNRKMDGLYWGLVPGMLLPVITFILMWALGSELLLHAFIKRSIELKVLAKEISLANISNLAVFFIYIWTSRYRSARGVIMATFFWVVIMLVAKAL